MRSFSDRELVSLQPQLKGLAFILTQDADRANDLVQDTCERALRHAHAFDGRNLKGWLFKMMANLHFSNWRRFRNVTYVEDGILDRNAAPEVDVLLRLDMQRAWMRTRKELNPDHVRALELVGVLECSYEAAAKQENVPVGTMKSRVARARNELEIYLTIGQ